MKPEYRKWIAEFVAAHNDFVRGECAKATTAMVEAFPELRRAAGFAHWMANRPIRDQHFWCVTQDGVIVDPTAVQFGGSPVHYEELDLDDPETQAKIPTGACMNCGDDVYEGAYCCSDRCERAVYADMGLAPPGK